MMTENEAFRSHILSLVQDAEFQTDAAKIQAKALLSEITEQVPLYRWTYMARRIVRNIVMATFEFENIARENTHEIEYLSRAARKFALVWESLAQLHEATSRETAFLNSAVNYELAGYQANAMCIAKYLNHSFSLIEKPSLIDLGGLFLQRRFLQLL